MPTSMSEIMPMPMPETKPKPESKSMSRPASVPGFRPVQASRPKFLPEFLPELPPGPKAWVPIYGGVLKPMGPGLRDAVGAGKCEAAHLWVYVVTLHYIFQWKDYISKIAQ